RIGIILDWRKRIRIALGAANGLTYLHEHANPPIIHRDVKSINILLDETLNANLSYKSHVYSYGVVLLEILSGKEPIERGKYLVREVRTAIERGGINALAQRWLLDTILTESPMTPSILGSFIRLALHCFENYGKNRPKMSEVMKELEAIAEDMGDNERDEETTKFGGAVLAIHPYVGSASFDYSGSGGNIVPSFVQPK
ncbi:hypothetical protein KI387_017725, partial [Taxus chinensis]